MVRQNEMELERVKVKKWDGLATVTWVLTIGAAIAAVLGLATYFASTSTTVAVVDGELYESLDQLSGDADLVVQTEVIGVAARYADYAGDPVVDERGDSIPPLRKIIYNLRAVRVLEGTDSSPIISVVVDDIGDDMIDGWSPKLNAGQRLVLYLFDVPAELGSSEVQAMDATFGPLYGVVGGKQGVFDVVNDGAISRSETVRLTLDLSE